MKPLLMLQISLFIFLFSLFSVEAGTGGRCCTSDDTPPRNVRIKNLKEKLTALINTSVEERSEKFDANWYYFLTNEIRAIEGDDDFRLADYKLTKEDVFKYYGKSKALEICRVIKEKTDDGIKLAKDIENEVFVLDKHLELLFYKEREAKQKFDFFISDVTKDKKVDQDLIESWTKTANACLLTEGKKSAIKQEFYDTSQCSLALQITKSVESVEKLLATNSYGDLENPWLSQLFLNDVYSINSWILEVEKSKDNYEAEPTRPKLACVDHAIKTGHETILKMFGQSISATDKKVKELQQQLKKLAKKDRKEAESEIKRLKTYLGNFNVGAGHFILYMTKKDFKKDINDNKAE